MAGWYDMMRMLGRWAVLAAALASASPGMAQVAGAVPAAAVPIETPEAALERDAGEYARRYGVPPDQAMRDLSAQQQSVPATDAIAREFADRLVGIAVDHVPAFRITVVLAGAAPVAARTLAVAGSLVPVEFHVGARATGREVVAAITRDQAPIRAALLDAPGIGLDVRTGEMAIFVSAADAAFDGREELGRRFSRLTGMPVRIEVSGTPLDLMVAGGSRISGYVAGDPRRFVCTSGFAVTDGARTGIATAAHCPDALSYADADRGPVPLPFVTQSGWGYQDVQINASADQLAPLFYADTGRTLVRLVAGQQRRASTRVGDFVCHRGERTGYSCAEILLTDFAPPGDLCGGPCLPTWVAVEGPTCQGGDSGAPVFSGEVALGIVKGGTYRSDGSCAMYYYMSLDYLPTGWSLLLGVPSMPLPAAAEPVPTPLLPTDATPPLPIYPPQ